VIPIPACNLVTAPVGGRLTRHAATDTLVRKGDVVATIDASGREFELRAAVGGRVGGPMLRPTQSVAAGDGVIWLARGAA
jgi:biotin carboxyl carrier protein